MLLSAELIAGVVPSPDLRCASVDMAGGVTLTWELPPDPNGQFASYEVFRAGNLAGPYTDIASVSPYVTPSYADPGAGADLGPRFYYVRTVSITGDTAVASDTLSTIFLTVGQSVPLGSAALDWTLMHTPPLPSAEPVFGIDMEYPQGTWDQIDTLSNLLSYYEQVISICEDSLTYRILLLDASGCFSSSNLAGDVFSDVTPPTPPDIISASVDTTTNQTVFTWQPSPEDDTNGYIIVQVIDGVNVIIDTIFGQNNTTYEWVGSDAGANAESWTVAAFDTCYHGTPPSPNTSAANGYHTTIHTTLQYDRCASDVRITWSAYNGWPVEAYELYVRVDNGPPALLASFVPGTFTFLHEAVDHFRNYCYTVRGVSSSGLQTLSNQACLFTAYPAVPQWNYLRLATVAEENHVVVIDSVQTNARARAYHLERSNNGGLWEEIAVQPGGGPSGTRVFDDLDVLTATRSYQYRVIVEDSCGVPVLTSNQATSINLVAEAGLDGINRLRWNGYVEWAGPVTAYSIYRSVADGPFTLLATNAPGDWEYDDDVNAFISTNGKFCYYVEAYESGNPSGIDATSTSNIACAVQPEAIWIPNAFIQGTGGGKNSYFKPVFAFVDVKGYELIIYNRWGQEIWSSTDPEQPWFGVVDGNYVPQGVYAYYCTALNGAGKRFEERGTVTFLCCQE